MTPLRILLRLHRGYGLGDAVMFSVVLQHLRARRPHWQIDFCAERGKHSAGHGLCERAFAYEDPDPPKAYDREATVMLFDNPGCWIDRPCTRAVSCLHEMFGMAWEEPLGRYKVCVSPEARAAAADRLDAIDPKTQGVVLIHYEGKSAPQNKNLAHEQAGAFCRAVIELGRIPVVLNWRGHLPLPPGAKVFDGEAGRERNPTDTTWPGWGGDAEHLAAVVGQVAAFVGIDSGPGKVASATETPALICWTDRHHPLQFHDPAPNTTHLLPEGHEKMVPILGDLRRLDYFKQAYLSRTYSGDLVAKVGKWLREVIHDREAD